MSPIIASTAGRCLVRVSRRSSPASTAPLRRVIYRRLTTETSQDPPVPTKRKRTLRTIFLLTTTAVGTFYIGSPFVAFHNQTYYDFFSDNVPMGQPVIEFAEVHDWEHLSLARVLTAGKNVLTGVQRIATGQKSPSSAPSGSDGAKPTVLLEPSPHEGHKTRIGEVVSALKTKVEKSEDIAIHGSAQAAAIARHRIEQFSEGVEELVREAEAAIAKYAAANGDAPASTPPPPLSKSPASSTTKTKVYELPLPIGFEPPPGFVRPSPTKADVPTASTEAKAKPVPPPKQTQPPLIAPAISELTASEPHLAHLASTIDTLASYLGDNPAAASTLSAAQSDLTALATHLDKIKSEEHEELEKKLEEQTKQYTSQLLELEMAAQDRLDGQEEEFRKLFDEERAKILHSYREKLENELTVQTELINERLKQEVIAQGIELQRRWIREIKVRVEQERGGRLAKLDELAFHIKQLEQLTLANAAHLEETLRVHALWAAIRRLHRAIDAPVRTPFRDDLRRLRHIATAAAGATATSIESVEGKEELEEAAPRDPLLSAVLESLDASDTPDIGVEPFGDLVSWFTSSVAPRVSRVALVPAEDEGGAGVLAHLASGILSRLQFHRTGLVPGNDVQSVLARAEWYLNEKDLDSATRELNQLKGTARVLLRDWLDAARRRLEMQQALEVLEAQATVASMLVAN